MSPPNRKGGVPPRVPQPLSQAGRHRLIRHAQPHYQQAIVFQQRVQGGVHRVSGVYTSNFSLAQLLTAVRAAANHQQPILAQGDLVTISDETDANRELRFVVREVLINREEVTTDQEPMLLDDSGMACSIGTAVGADLGPQQQEENGDMEQGLESNNNCHNEGAQAQTAVGNIGARARNEEINFQQAVGNQNQVNYDHNDNHDYIQNLINDMANHNLND